MVIREVAIPIANPVAKATPRKRGTPMIIQGSTPIPTAILKAILRALPMVLGTPTRRQAVAKKPTAATPSGVTTD